QGLDEPFVAERGQPAVPDQPAVLDRDQVVPGSDLGQLAPHHPDRPLLRAEQVGVQPHRLVDVPPPHRLQRDRGLHRVHTGVTGFRAVGIVTSGRRRYSGVNGSAGAAVRIFSAARSTSVATVGYRESSSGRPSTSAYSSAPAPAIAVTPNSGNRSATSC